MDDSEILGKAHKVVDGMQHRLHILYKLRILVVSQMVSHMVHALRLKAALLDLAGSSSWLPPSTSQRFLLARASPYFIPKRSSSQSVQVKNKPAINAYSKC